MDRERVTISIDKNVLQLIDKTIDKRNIRNRSHAIESLVLKAVGQKARNALVLLGGNDALKAIPATEAFLDELSAQGFSKANIAVGYLGDKVLEKLGDGDRYGIALEYSEKGEGSGGAVLSHKKEFNSTFLVFNSLKKIDDLDLDFLLAYHRDHNNIATILTDDLTTYRGIYLFEPGVFRYLKGGFSMIEEDLIPTLIKDGKAAILPLTV